LEARGLKFCTSTPHVNTKKVTNQIFEILSGRLKYIGASDQVCWQRTLGIYMKSLHAKFHSSCFQTEGGDKRLLEVEGTDGRTDAICKKFIVLAFRGYAFFSVQLSTEF